MSAVFSKLVAILGCYLSLFMACAIAFITANRGWDAMSRGGRGVEVVHYAFPAEPKAAAFAVWLYILVIPLGALVFRWAARRIGLTGTARRATWAAAISGSVALLAGLSMAL